jgi:seryl-tRNA synthetase
VKLFRNQLSVLQKAVKDRNFNSKDIQEIIDVDIQLRSILHEADLLKNQRNQVSAEVAIMKKSNQSADTLIEQMKIVGDQIKQLDDEIRQLEENLSNKLLFFPNIPHESVPVGKLETDNVETRKNGQIPEFSFQIKSHWEIAENLGILDFESASKVTGSRFVFYKDLGARLERALINFMMDYHTDFHGYREMLPPYIVNRDSLTGTGQLPKFEEDAFKIVGTDYFLIPTAEVPVTNYYRDQILTAEQLPVNWVAYSACFRSEAGSAGRDTRGLIRQHQFNKVELVKIVKPEDSYEELEKLTSHAEKILQLLQLPYRVISLCTGDLGFSSAKTYDIEVWMPSASTYREISSCSNFEDFQARRASIRYRKDIKSKPEFVHTLNGSGLAIGRTLAAIIENNQLVDGTVKVPDVLVPYMRNVKLINKI